MYIGKCIECDCEIVSRQVKQWCGNQKKKDSCHYKRMLARGEVNKLVTKIKEKASRRSYPIDDFRADKDAYSYFDYS